MEDDHRMLCAIIEGGVLLFKCVHAHMHVHNVFMFLCHTMRAEMRRKL